MVGSCFLGMTIFYNYEEAFGSFTKSFYTLVALQCGDMVYGFYEETTKSSLIFGTLFSYGYIFFAVSQVQSIFMVIVEDSFVEVKYKRSHEWLLNDEQENSQRDLNNSYDNGGDGENGGNGDIKALPPPPIVLPQFLISD